MSSLIVKKQISLSPSSLRHPHACDQHIKQTLGFRPLSIPLSVLKRVAAEAARAPGSISCIVAHTGSAYKLIDAGTEKSFSIALDLGTTNLAAQLYDNVRQAVVAAVTLENPQTSLGSDILTRMHHAMSPRGEEVYGSLKEGVNLLITLLCGRAGIEARDVHCIAAAGNTVMSHFFLGLDISTIPKEPFAPAVRAPGFFSAAELSLELNPEAVVYVFPNAGSYVGGDIVAGILASGIHRSDHTSVLIDVGTNAEIVIGNKDWMIVGAGAAGPALEEGISRAGRRASSGIIHDVEIRNGKAECKTFDNLPPEGICGSGMVSLVHALYQAGIINAAGALNPEKANVTIIDNEIAYTVTCSSPLFIRQSEIDNFMKSKAAMFTLLLVLARSVGIGFKDIARVFVSGALGTGIDARKAVAIGMLPAWPAEIVNPLGNTSLKGASMLLEDSGLLDEIDAVSEKITYKHMHDDPEFMKEFMGAVFIPHTNPELLKAE